jgi:hypothetical protein
MRRIEKAPTIGFPERVLFRCHGRLSTSGIRAMRISWQSNIRACIVPQHFAILSMLD